MCPVRYLLQDGVNTVRYVLSNGVKVFSPEIINIAQGQGVHFLEASTAARVNGEYVHGVPGSESMAGNLTVRGALKFLTWLNIVTLFESKEKRKRGKQTKPK